MADASETNQTLLSASPTVTPDITKRSHTLSRAQCTSFLQACFPALATAVVTGLSTDGWEATIILSLCSGTLSAVSIKCGERLRSDGDRIGTGLLKQLGVTGMTSAGCVTFVADLLDHLGYDELKPHAVLAHLAPSITILGTNGFQCWWNNRNPVMPRIDAELGGGEENHLHAA